MATAVLCSLGAVLVAGCSTADREQVGRLALPEPATDRGAAVAELWQGAWIAALVVGVFVWFLIGYAVVRYRRRNDDDVPLQTRYNLPIEILYTVAPVIVVLVLFYFTITTQDEVLAAPADDADVELEVVGQQWSWAFNYLGEEAVAGQDVYFVGTPAERPTLYLPVGESVEVDLRSPDVIHSFWVPAFLYKLDVVPGLTNSFSFTPTERGRFPGRCAELCGAYHSRMLFNVRVVSRAQYDEYLRSLERQGSVGRAIGGEAADTQPGLEDEVQDDDATNLGDSE